MGKAGSSYYEMTEVAHIPFATLSKRSEDRAVAPAKADDIRPIGPIGPIGPIAPPLTTECSSSEDVPRSAFRVPSSEVANLQSTFVNPCLDPSWNNRLSAFPAATPFHTSNWCSVLAEAYGYEPCYLVFDASTSIEDGTSNDYTLRALLPLFSVSSRLTGRRGVSLPFTDFCAPLVNPCSSVSSVVEQLRSAAIQLGREKHWKYLELRGAGSLFSHSTIQRFNDSTSTPSVPSSEFRVPRLIVSSSPSVPRSEFRVPRSDPSTLNAQPSTSAAAPQFVQHELDLRPGEAALWRRLESSCQRAIRKARAAGVTIRKVDFSNTRSTRDMRAFYHLQCRTRRKHGLPPQPYRFFELIQRHMLESNLGSLYLAEIGGKDTDDKVTNCKVANRQVIAGALYLHFGKSVIFKYGASDERHLDLRANNLVMWQAIADYAAAGFQTLNFGRTELDNSGLKRYKLGFGAQEITLHYHKFDYATDSFVPLCGTEPGALMRLAQSIFRYTPFPVARAIGAFLYPHVA